MADERNKFPNDLPTLDAVLNEIETRYKKGVDPETALADGSRFAALYIDWLMVEAKSDPNSDLSEEIGEWTKAMFRAERGEFEDLAVAIAKEGASRLLFDPMVIDMDSDNNSGWALLTLALSMRR